MHLINGQTPFEKGRLKLGESLKLIAHNISNLVSDRVDPGFGFQRQAYVRDLRIANRTADLTHQHAVRTFRSGDTAGRAGSNFSRRKVIELSDVGNLPAR